MTERCGLCYCVSTMFTTNKLISNATKLNQKLGSEHRYSVTKQSTLRSDMSQVLNEFLILNFRRVLIVVSFLLGKSPASVY